jgi:FtsP/CotA-like multicopper oxidase with cupredoxin domain
VKLAPVTLLVALSGCGPNPNEALPSASDARPIDLAVAPDVDPARAVVSTRLVAAPVSVEILPERHTALLGYSGTFPGPLIRARRGDRLRVELENQLTEPTTLHWHGMRVPNAMDGVPDVTQGAVEPGGRFTYDFIASDAGLFWYHPHHESLAALGAGLYGAVLVDDPEDERDLGDEVVLVLSDLSLDESGARQPDASDPATVIAGHEGSVVLVNGRVRPTLPVMAGRRQRLRVLNAARSRYFRLALEGHAFLQIGSDGGRMSSPVEVLEPVLTPGERLDLLLEPHGAVGTSTALVALPIARGLPFPPSEQVTLLDVEVVESSKPPSPPLPSLDRAVTPLDPAGATLVPIALTMDERETTTTMGINGMPSAHDTPIHARPLEKQVLVVENQTPYDHPFHLHGFFFEEIDDNGSRRLPLQRKDTVNVPPLSSRRFLVQYDERPGMWMFHCHILDHAQAGMMGMIYVMP